MEFHLSLAETGTSSGTILRSEGGGKFVLEWGKFKLGAKLQPVQEELSSR